jgi:hypothetical protein
MKDWTLLVAPWAQNLLPPSDQLLPALLELFQHPHHVMKDDRRSLVFLVETLPFHCPGQGPWVCKRPRWHDNRLWNQLMSLVREGEMRRSYRAALFLEQLGMATPRPMLCLERRRWGMVVESWLVYEYARGEAVGQAQWSAVVAALEGLHRAGLRHGDPHLANWLVDGQGGVLMLDPGPRPLRPGFADDAYDFVLLRNCQPAILPLLPLRQSWKWRVAEFRDSWVHGLRNLKRWLRAMTLGHGRKANPSR